MTVLAAFHPLGPDRLREVTGLDFEAFAAGQRFRHLPAITLSQEDNVAESLLTLNQAQLHYDAYHAAATEFGRPLMVSTLTLQRALGMGWKTFGRRRRIRALPRIVPLRPVFAGDTLRAESRILSADPLDADCGLVRAEIALVRPGEGAAPVFELVCDMEIWRHGRGPLPGLGYTSGDPAGPAAIADWPSHRPDRAGVLCETLGLPASTLRPGLIIEHRPGFLVDAREAHARARLAGDHAPVRIDPALAGDAGAMGAGWALSALTAATTRAFGLVVANLGWEDVRIGAGPADGMMLLAESEILELRASRSRPGQAVLHVRTRGLGRDGTEYACFRRRLLTWMDFPEPPET